MSQWLTIEFNDLDNAAFSGEDVGPELGRILRDLARKFEVMSRAEFVNDDADCKLKDINGNTIGSVSGNFEADEDDEDDQALYDGVRHFTKWMSRGDIELFVIDHCHVVISSDDTEEELVDAIVVAIKAGDTSLDHLENFADKS